MLDVLTASGMRVELVGGSKFETLLGGSASGFTKVVITVDGRPGSSGEGSQSMSFAVSDRYFVMSSDVRVRDALRDGLGLSEPRC